MNNVRRKILANIFYLIAAVSSCHKHKIAVLKPDRKSKVLDNSAISAKSLEEHMMFYMQ